MPRQVRRGTRVMQWLVALTLLACSPEADMGSSHLQMFSDSGARVTHVILGAGQSNMMGQGVTPPTVTDPASIPYWVRIVGEYQSTVLESLGPINNKHGVELAMLPPLRDAGHRVAMMKDSSTGGTTVSQWVNSGSPTMWPGLASNFATFKPLLVARNGASLLWHFVWIQGEADSNSEPPNAAAYSTPLRVLLTQLRDPSMCGASMRAYIVALNPAAYWPEPGKSYVRAAEQDVGSDTGNVYIETNGIPMGGDNIHYDSAGCNAVGVLLKTAILANL